MFTRDHFEKINGFSNSFWLWGWEDDNLWIRAERQGLKVKRQSMNIARYKMITHEKSKDKKWNDDNTKYNTKEFYDTSLKNLKTDGLSSLQYEVISRVERSLYTHITVNLNKASDLKFGVEKYDEADLLY